MQQQPSSGLIRTDRFLELRTRGKTWQVDDSVTIGEFAPVEVFGRHQGKYYCRPADLDLSKRERVRLFKSVEAIPA